MCFGGSATRPGRYAARLAQCISVAARFADFRRRVAGRCRRGRPRSAFRVFSVFRGGCALGKARPSRSLVSGAPPMVQCLQVFRGRYVLDSATRPGRYAARLVQVHFRRCEICRFPSGESPDGAGEGAHAPLFVSSVYFVVDVLWGKRARPGRLSPAPRRWFSVFSVFRGRYDLGSVIRPGCCTARLAQCISVAARFCRFPSGESPDGAGEGARAPLFGETPDGAGEDARAPAVSSSFGRMSQRDCDQR